MTTMLLLLLIAQAGRVITPVQNTTVKPDLTIQAETDEQFFAASDKNRDGFLSYPEFEAAFEAKINAALSGSPGAQKKLTPEDRAKMRESFTQSFRALDLNSDGRLSIAEVKSHGQRQ